MMNPNRSCFAVFVRSLLIVASAVCASVHAADPGEWVVVVYNSRVPESKEVAEYYAQRREVPPGQVLGFNLPVTESMTRAEFTEQLQKPLLAALEAKKLF